MSVILTEDWKADGYQWYQNGRKFLPSSGPVVEKIYYFLLAEDDSAPVKSKEFRKTAYHHHKDPRGKQGTLVQYLGEDATCIQGTYTDALLSP